MTSSFMARASGAKEGAGTVDTETVFEIGWASKAFLGTTLAIMVDRSRFKWDDRVVDLYPDFQLKDPWVTREFRVFDLIAQRSSLPPYANDMLGMVGVSETDMVPLLALCRPGFQFPFYVRLYKHHSCTGPVGVAKAAGAADWNAVLRQELLEPLGMKIRRTQPQPSRPHLIMPKVIVGLLRALSQCPSHNSSLTISAARATSILISRILRTGSGSNSPTARSRADVLCRQRTWRRPAHLKLL